MKITKTKECLNCHQIIDESNYCPNCGQINTDKRVPFRHFFEGFFSDYFTFDSKFFRSIFPLVLKPGHLTSQYLEGKRTSYILPLRLYIFTTFLFFFIVTVNSKIGKELSEPVEKSDILIIRNKVDSLKNLMNDEDIELSAAVKMKITEELMDTISDADLTDSSSGLQFDIPDEGEEHGPIVQYLIDKARYVESLGEEGKAVFVKELINQIPKVMFILLPLFALLLKVLYIRRKIFYIEHLIFSLHYHTFIFLSLTLSIILDYGWITTITVIGTFLYLYIAIRKFYGQGRFKSFLKFGMLVFAYTILMIPALGLLAVLTIVSI